MRTGFSSGVASGDVTTTSVVLWTRVDAAPGAEVEVEWAIRPVGHDVGTGDALRGHAVASPDDDHTVHVEVDGLAPGTTYVYEFRLGDDLIAGRTRTLPTAATSFRLAVACCSRWGWPGFEQYGRIVDERPDLLLHLGDAIYEIGESPPAGPPTLPPWDCRTLADYRQRHRQHRSHPALRHLLANVPALAVWDDHEVADNAPDPGNADRRRAGQRAWAEWTPSRRVETAGPLDRHLAIGGLLDLSLVDARFRGRYENEVDGPGAARHAPARLLSDTQWSRLTSTADESTAPWFVVANQVQVGPMTLAGRPALGWPPWRRIVNPDQWDGYPDARARLYDVMRRTERGRIVLSGDLHSSWARRLLDGDGGAFATEFTCPSISGITYAAAVQGRLPIPGRWLSGWLRAINPGIDHLDLRRHGYLVCDVEPDRFTATFVTTDGRRHVETVRSAPDGGR